MKITIEWIQEHIDTAHKNYQFAKDNKMENIALLYQGQEMAYQHVLFKKIMSGWMYPALDKHTSKWKKFIIKILYYCINKLEGHCA